MPSYALGDRDAVAAWRDLVASDPAAPARLADWFFDDRDLDTQVADLAAEAGLAARDVAAAAAPRGPADRHAAPGRRRRRAGGGPRRGRRGLARGCPRPGSSTGCPPPAPPAGPPSAAPSTDRDGGADLEPADGLSLASFVAGLRVETEFREARDGDLAKIKDMLVASKEFNLGVPIPPAAVDAMPAAADRVLLLGSVRDRLGDLGPSVVLALAGRGADCVVEAFVISCPAMGKGVEARAMREIAAHARALGAERIVVGYRETGRNRAAIDFLHSPTAGGTARTPDGATLDLLVRAETPDTEAVIA